MLLFLQRIVDLLGSRLKFCANEKGFSSVSRKTAIIFVLKKGIVFHCILISCVAIMSCNALTGKNRNRYLKKQDGWPILANVFKTDIEKYVDYWPRFEFAIDGSNYILCWWSPSNDPYEKRLGRAFVFNFKGEVVDATEDDGKTIKSKFVDLFPSAIYRQKWLKFTEGADGYGFSNDECYGLRVFANLRSDYWGAKQRSFCDNTRKRI